MQLKYHKGKCAKTGIGLLGKYRDEETGGFCSFLVPIKTRGAGQNPMIEFMLQYEKKFPSEKKLKSRMLDKNSGEYKDFIKENPNIKEDTYIVITEYDTTSESHIKGMLKQTNDMAYLNAIAFIDFDRKCYDGKSLIEVINEDRVENKLSPLQKENYFDMLDWIKGKELSDMELKIFDEEIKRVERGEKTFAEQEYDLLLKANDKQ